MILIVHLEIVGRPFSLDEKDPVARVYRPGYAIWRLESLTTLEVLAELARERTSPIRTSIGGLVNQVEWRKIPREMLHHDVSLRVDCDGRLTLYTKSVEDVPDSAPDIWTTSTTLEHLRTAVKQLDRNVFVPHGLKSQKIFCREVFEDQGVVLPPEAEEESLEGPRP